MMKIEELGLSPRVEKILKENMIYTVEELRAIAPERLKKIKGLGEASILEIHKKMLLGGGCEICGARAAMRVTVFDALEHIATFTPSFCPKCGHKVSD